MFTASLVRSIEAILDECIPMSANIPVTFEGGLYFPYRVHYASLDLVPVHDLWTIDEYVPGDDPAFSFEPMTIINVPESHSEMPKLVAAIRTASNQVSCRFAQLDNNRMKILVEGEPLPTNATGRFFIPSPEGDDSYSLSTQESYPRAYRDLNSAQEIVERSNYIADSEEPISIILHNIEYAIGESEIVHCLDTDGHKFYLCSVALMFNDESGGREIETLMEPTHLKSYLPE